jgi:hypothetical protein
MADQGQPWVFKQLKGPQKTFTLSGWSAPLGRSRQGAVVRTPQKARTERTYYPGSDIPTRHIFGLRYDDVELKGRFRDKDLGGLDGARGKTDELKAFQADQQPIQVTWGNIISFTGFMDEFDPGYEAPDDIEWVIRISVDQPEQGARVVAQKPPVLPQVSADLLLGSIEKIRAARATLPLQVDLLDQLDDAIDLVAEAIGIVRGAVTKLSSFKEATFGELNRAVSGVSALRSAGRGFRELFVSSVSDAQLLASRGEITVNGFRGDDFILMGLAEIAIEEQIRLALDEAAKIERASDLARIGRIKATYAASPGDSWETISIRYYGTPGRANDLRTANDAGAGERPVPGVEYLIPT